jgi:hypothetical protein
MPADDRRLFFKRLLGSAARTAAEQVPDLLDADGPAGLIAKHLAPLPTITVPPDQDDIAQTLVRHRVLAVGDGAGSYAVRRANAAPSGSPLATWIARLSAKDPLVPFRPADALMLEAIRADLSA